MKKYLINLVRHELQREEVALKVAIRIIERDSSSTFWQRRKQSLENKIEKIKSYLEALEGMEIKMPRKSTTA